ncbi:MAG: hypothetical protein K6E78_04160 [Treponema sp.]|nr:hypothetical protein [Treponema sp.]
MDDIRPKQADWAPGTLEKTRKAIGNIDAAEAMKMSKVLGGEVMYERTQNFSGNGKKGTGKIVRSPSSGSGSGSSSSASSSNSSGSDSSSGSSLKGRKHQEELPVISQKLAAQIDKLMMAPEFGIKPNYGFFNFIKYFQNNGHEQLVTEFVVYTMKMHIENLQGFITVIKTMIQMAPASYKAKIANGTEVKFKFLRMVAGWTMQSIKLAHVDLQNLPQPYVTADLIPYTRAVYRLLIQVYYYGETKIPHLIKEIFADMSAYPDSPKEKISGLAKEAITQWLYIQNEIIRKMYPLLMRMCSNTYEEYPAFFKAKVADILKFCGLHKYDLLLQEKPQPAEEEKKEEEKKPAAVTKGVKDGLVNSGLSILNNFFPQAGFDKLETHPDMYPYFQPLYKFADGFNCLSPENPLQVTIVLLRIIEDLLRGCRNIKFKKTSEEEKKGADSISQVMDDWINYREDIFEHLYCEPLTNLVNQVYSQADFENTQFGKKLLSSLLWQTALHYLPNFKFEKLLLERPTDEAKVRPLFHRTDFARQYLTKVVTQCDHLAAAKGDVSYLENPWEHYKFDIPNEVSKRLDVVLGAQNKTASTTATNANLLKYTLCVISVLDWWINNHDSPAYSTSPMHIYRINPDDGKPQFSVDERHDQNKLFADQIRAAYQKG